MPVSGLMQIRTRQRPGKRRERKKNLTCPICGIGIRYPVEMKIHQRVHTGEKPYRCTMCPARFAQSGYLKVHLRSHTGEKPYACHHCGKCFSLSSALKSHIRLHTGEKPFVCSYCVKSFASKRYLQRHQRRVHTGTVSIEPNWCIVKYVIFCNVQILGCILYIYSSGWLDISDKIMTKHYICWVGILVGTCL